MSRLYYKISISQSFFILEYFFRLATYLHIIFIHNSFFEPESLESECHHEMHVNILNGVTFHLQRHHHRHRHQHKVVLEYQLVYLLLFFCFSQQVWFDGTLSSKRYLILSVPQRSVFGPLLINLFIKVLHF